jgi:gliding motility-associated-like protein
MFNTIRSLIYLGAFQFLFLQGLQGQDLLTGLIVHYPMTGNAQDIGPNGFDGIVSGAVLGPDQDGIANGAYYFDGTDDFIDFPIDPLLKPDFTFTIACVVKYDAPMVIDDTQIFTTDFEQDNYHGAWSNLVNGRIGISYGANGGNTNASSRRTKLGTTVLNAGQWYRLTFIVRSELSMEIYIDCVNDGGSYSGTGPTQILYSNVPGCIGRQDSDMSGPAHYFRGAMSDFRMWSRELSEFDITYMCNEIEPCITSISSDTTICLGSAAMLQIQSTDFVGWAAATAPTVVISTDPNTLVSPSINSIYLAYTLCDTVPVQVQVLEAPVVDFQLSVDSGCQPLQVQFGDSSVIAAGATVSWNWDFGDGTTSQLQHPNHQYTSAGIFDVSLTVAYNGGCSAIFQAQNAVSVSASPIAAFSYTPTVVNVLGPEVQFGNQSIGATSWQWNFGDGFISNQQHPAHAFEDAGIFLVEMIAVNDAGCTDTTHRYYEVKPVFTIYVPNAFTPGGNRKNEVFYAYGEGVTKFRMRIYNRWGMELFRSENILTGWDGTYLGQPAQMGVYTWKIDASSDFGEEFNEVGRVTLLR